MNPFKSNKRVLVSAPGLSRFVEYTLHSPSCPTIDVDALLSVIVDLIIHYPYLTRDGITEYLINNGLLFDRINPRLEFTLINDILKYLDPVIDGLIENLYEAFCLETNTSFQVDYKKTWRDNNVILEVTDT